LKWWYFNLFTTIIEQTAEIYRSIFGSDNLLEHHSAIPEENDKNDDMNQARLAVQNWDSSIIVTTTVQLLESLFSNHPSKCRKVHNIAGSVIVIDEVQALPANLMTPILSMLQNLVDYAECSILLCTATQPAYEFIKNTNCQPKDIIPESLIQEHFAKLKRVEYFQVEGNWNWSNVRADIQRRNLQQTLIVANTTADARNAFKEIKEIYDKNCYHLSTRMYPKHRLRVLNEIQKLLLHNQRCCLVSTQLIEAGVDLDFSDGYRVIAPLDSIVQSAGRINRNGKLDRLGTMTVFKLSEGKYPSGDYQQCARLAQQIIDLGNNLNDAMTFHKYFEKRFEYKNTDNKKIQYFREEMEFKMVADKFKLIEDESESVFIREEIEAQQLLEEFQKKGFISKNDFKSCQNYMVKLSPSILEQRKSDWSEPVAGLRVWSGDYNLEYGIE
jgi:CRISPR-associated endonuclease/helicase Cas3